MLNKDSLFTLLSRAGLLLGGFSASIICAHALGVAGRGEYYYIITLSYILCQFSNLGLQSSNVYYFSNTPSIFNDLLDNSIIISILVGLIAVTISFLYFYFIKQSIPNGFYFLIPIIPLSLFCLLASNLLVAQSRIRAFNIFELANGLLPSILFLIAFFMKPTVYIFLSMFVLAWGISALFLAKLIVKKSIFSIHFHYGLFKKMFMFGIKVYLATLAGLLIAKLNILVLMNMCGNEQVGLYSIAAQICDALTFIPNTFSILLFPKLINTEQHSRLEVFHSCLFQTAIIMGIICYVIFLTAPMIIPLVFGTQFADSVTVINNILPAAFFLGLTSITSQLTAANGFSKIIVGIWFAALLIIGLLNSLLITHSGARGAALSLSIAYAMVFIAIYSYAIFSSKQSKKIACSVQLTET